MEYPAAPGRHCGPVFQSEVDVKNFDHFLPFVQERTLKAIAGHASLAIGATRDRVLVQLLHELV